MLAINVPSIKLVVTETGQYQKQIWMGCNIYFDDDETSEISKRVYFIDEHNHYTEKLKLIAS